MEDDKKLKDLNQDELYVKLVSTNDIPEAIDEENGIKESEEFEIVEGGGL